MTDTPMTPEREQKIRMSRTHCEAVRFEAEEERPLHVWGPSQYPTKDMCQRCTVMRWWAEDSDADEVVLLAEVDRLRGELSDATGQVEFLQRNTLPDLNRQIEHHKGGKARWRKRAEIAEGRVAELTAAPVDEAAELAEGLAGLDTMRREHPAPCRVPDAPDCTCPDKLPIFTGAGWDGPIARCSFGEHMGALLPSGRIGRHRMGEGWLNACPGVGKPPRADEETAP